MELKKFLGELKRVHEAAEVGHAEGKVGIGVVRALRTFRSVYEQGRQGDIKKYQHLLEYYPDYVPEMATNVDTHKKVYDGLWKDVVELKKWLPIFYRAANNKDSQYRIYMSKAKGKVKLLDMANNDSQDSTTKRSSRRIKTPSAADTADIGANIGHLTIQNSEGFTIVGRDVNNIYPPKSETNKRAARREKNRDKR